MRYVAAYLLSALGGNGNPSASDIKNILGSVGIDCDDDKLNMVIDELKGKNIEEVLAAGTKLLFMYIWNCFLYLKRELKKFTSQF